MKKIVIFITLVLFVGVVASGCSSIEPSSSSTQNKSSEKKDNNEPLTKEDENFKEETSSEKGNNEQVFLNVYYCNGNVDGFATKTFELEEVTPDVILEKLVENSVLNSSVKINEFKTVSENGEKIVVIDFNEEVINYLNSLGSSQEYYIIGSVCNTFIDAYQSNKIRITVNEKQLETNHADYSKEMMKFEEQ